VIKGKIIDLLLSENYMIVTHKLWSWDLSHSIHNELGNPVSYKFGPVSFFAFIKEAVQA